MSEISEAARIWLMTSDFANTEAGIKQNLIGAGWDIMPALPTGRTYPIAVSAIIDVPNQFANADYSVEIFLRDDANRRPVVAADWDGPEAKAVRFANVVRASANFAPGIPAQEMHFRHHAILNFSAGLPLPAGRMYSWVLRIDGDEQRQAECQFYVPAPASGPIVG